MNTEYQDIIIIGAGLSGIGAASHFSKKCPGKSLAILESRDNMGGTWDLFKYPGLRSDSDMFTLGYNFKPWNNKDAIGDGADILRYIKEAAKEQKIEDKIRYQHKVTSIEWSSESATWTLQVEEAGKRKTMVCNFLMSCTGYYNYESGYTPNFKGREDFNGQFIHPQKWPENLDYTDKKVVVIGSGATAVTLLPELAKKAQSVTMLQRSPTYIASIPKIDALSVTLRKFLPKSWVYRIARMRKVSLSIFFYNFCKKYPDKARHMLVGLVKKQLAGSTDLKHFKPKYAPWDERLCAVPDGDLFASLREGTTKVVTDTISHFNETGIVLDSGDTLEADIIVSATGLELQLMGGINVTVDGQPFKVSDSTVYRGVLFENLPNLGMVAGYTNASWTLKADLVSEYVCRLINYMDKKKVKKCMPINTSNFSQSASIDMTSGYLQRSLDQIPKQGSVFPWKLHQNYLRDMIMLRFYRINDGVLQFDKEKETAKPLEPLMS